MTDGSSDWVSTYTMKKWHTDVSINGVMFDENERKMETYIKEFKTSFTSLWKEAFAAHFLVQYQNLPEISTKIHKNS